MKNNHERSGSSFIQRTAHRAPIACTALAASVLAAASASAVPAASGHLLYGWGSNQFDQVNANAAGSPLLTPVRAIDMSTDIVQVAGGATGTLALHADGTVWAWGSYIMLGDGSTVTRATPGKVLGLPPIVQVATGFDHALAVGADGSLWAWGDNSYGALGVPVGGSTPVRVPLTGVAQVSAGHHFSVALKTTGEVFSWGNNADYELGQGGAVQLNVPYDSTPRRATAPYGIKQIAAGHYHVIALRNDGSVWAWGAGERGALGNGAFVKSSTAVRVDKRVSNIAKIAAGLNTSMAIGADGSVWNWGRNTEGELGDGTFVNKSVPVKVSLRAPAVLIEGGSQSSVAYLTDGTLWAWGGSIGFFNDPSHYSAQPTQVAGVSGVTQLAIDDNTILALMAPQPVPVPDLSYSDISGVAMSLEAAGLTLGTVTPLAALCNFGNEVIDQNPLPGALVPAGTPVAVTYIDGSICF